MLHLGTMDGKDVDDIVNDIDGKSDKKKKIPKRVETRTLVRILNYLHINGPQKRTRTSTYCNMSYSRFIPYTTFMISASMISMEGPAQLLIITQLGKDLLEFLQANSTD